MEDNQSAKIILSTLINEKIKKLIFEPVSHTEKIQDPKTLPHLLNNLGKLSIPGKLKAISLVLKT